MKQLTKKEMKQIRAGALSATAIWAIVAAGLSFLGGILDGQARLKWQNLKNTELIGNLREKPLIQIRRKD